MGVHSFVGGGPRCPIDIGTTPEQERERLGFDARASLVKARRERLERMAGKPAAPPMPLVPVKPPAPVPRNEDPLIGPSAPEAFFVARRCRRAGIVTTQWIIAEVCLYYGLKANDLVSQCKKRRYAEARQVGYWLTKAFIKSIGMRSIAERFGRVDHTTSYHGIMQVNIDIYHGGPRADAALSIKDLLLKHRVVVPAAPSVAKAPPRRIRGKRGVAILALAALRGSGEALGADQIAQLLKISTPSASVALGALWRQGKVVHAGTAKRGDKRRWRGVLVYRAAEAGSAPC